MKMLTLIMLFSATQVFAAPVKKSTTATTKAPVVATTAPIVAAPAPAPARSPWRLLYNGEYYGPRFSNFDLSQTQGPDQPGKPPTQSSYTNWNHTVKISYAITPEFIVGGALRMRTLFNPAVQSFAWKDNRLFFTWANMIDTDHVNMGTTVDFEFPTSQGSRAVENQQILAINLKNAWGFKIPSTDWSFGALTLIRNTYSNLPSVGEGIYLGFFPEIEYTVGSGFSLIGAGNFDASRSYKDIFWSLSGDDPDYLALGFKYAPNSHIEFHPAAQFYTADFNVPTLYFEMSVIF
jgi:hypothetical protein